jgi:hypothetical protein
MPEFLVITTKQNVLDAVERIRCENGVEIRLESDFTRGLKAIFYRLPDVVFIQEEIAGITAEKVSAQVRTLLDNEPIRLVLLHERFGEWDTGVPGFDGFIDTGIPFDDLVNRFREVLVSRGIDSDASQANAKEDESSLGSAAETGTQDTGFEFDPFSDIFPAQIHHNWGEFSAETGQDVQVTPEISRAPEEPSFVDYEFSFETPGEIVSSIPLEKPEPPVQEKGLPETDTKISDVSQTSAEEVDTRIPEKARHVGKESPHQLFASINEGDDLSRMETETPSSSVSERLRLKGVATQRSIMKGGTVEAPASSSSPSSTGADGMVGGGRGLQGASTRYPKKESGLRGVRGDAYATGNIRSLGKTPLFQPERNLLSRILKPGLLLLFVGTAAFFMFQNREYLKGYFTGKDEITEKPRSLNPPSGADLPSFIPRVPKDSVYTASHPGWERYPGGGIDYLIYREKGRLMAIQIIALPEGKISESFVRMCIRESTGLMDGDNWTKQEEGDFIIENSRLRDLGEIVVYRKFPDGEIRGIVLTFK